MPCVLIGETPEPGRGGPFDPATRAGRKLASLAGLRDIREAFGCIALLDRWPGKTAHGEPYPAGLAAQAADRLLRELPERTSFLLIGARVAKAFDLEPDPLSWWSVELQAEPGESMSDFHVGPPRQVAVFPHPGPGNTWWRSPGNEVRAGRFLRSLVREEKP